MKRKIALLLCAILLFSLVGCGGDSSTADENTNQEVENSYSGTEVNVMSYNVFYQDAAYRYETIFDIIREADPDVLFLQEVSEEWIPLLQEFMDSDGYAYYGYGRYGSEFSGVQEHGDQYAPVLWKADKYDVVEQGHFWLSSTPDEVRSSSWEDGTLSEFPRCNNWVKLKDKETEKEFMVSAIHLPPEKGFVPKNSIKLLNEKLPELAGDCPIIIGGDFNMLFTEDPYTLVTGGGFEDARFLAEETEKTKGTFHKFGEYDGQELWGDYIFVNKQKSNIKVKSFEILEDYMETGEHASDHFPIKSVIYLND